MFSWPCQLRGALAWPIFYRQISLESLPMHGTHIDLTVIFAVPFSAKQIMLKLSDWWHSTENLNIVLLVFKCCTCQQVAIHQFNDSFHLKLFLFNASFSIKLQPSLVLLRMRTAKYWHNHYLTITKHLWRHLLKLFRKKDTQKYARSLRAYLQFTTHLQVWSHLNLLKNWWES